MGPRRQGRMLMEGRKQGGEGVVSRMQLGAGCAERAAARLMDYSGPLLGKRTPPPLPF